MKDGNMTVDVQALLMQATRECLLKAVESRFNNAWDDRNPLKLMIDSAVEKQRGELQTLLDNAMRLAVCDHGFRDHVIAECNKKLAKCLISKMEGEIEKRANEMRADSAFRARLTLVITDIVQNLGKEKAGAA
jgi:hypothetical protein